MNWFPSLLFIPLLASSFFSSKFEMPAVSEEIVWSSDRKLSWDDFKSDPVAGRLSGAATYASIKALPRVVNYWNNKVEVEIKAIFRCDKSWAKEQAKSSVYLLNHEQRHFDIAEIFARKIRHQLEDYKITARNYPEIKAEVIEKLFDEYDAYDRSYDRLTVHGLNAEIQQEWNRHIDEQLASLPATVFE